MKFLKAIKKVFVKFIENRKGANKSVSNLNKNQRKVRSFIISPPPRPFYPLFDGESAYGELKPVPYVKKFTPQNIVRKLIWHPTKEWKKRGVNAIDRVVVHQSMSSGTIKGINNYHITPSPNNHISKTGCPHICYTYAIDRIGAEAPVYQTNWDDDIVWHTKGQNYRSIGVLVRGDFNGLGYNGQQKPTKNQLENIRRLMDFFVESNKFPLITDYSSLYGHQDFGKGACPGFEIYNEIIKLRSLK